MIQTVLAILITFAISLQAQANGEGVDSRPQNDNNNDRHGTRSYPPPIRYAPIPEQLRPPLSEIIEREMQHCRTTMSQILRQHRWRDRPDLQTHLIKACDELKNISSNPYTRDSDQRTQRIYQRMQCLYHVTLPMASLGPGSGTDNEVYAQMTSAEFQMSYAQTDLFDDTESSFESIQLATVSTEELLQQRRREREGAEDPRPRRVTPPPPSTHPVITAFNNRKTTCNNEFPFIN